MPFPFKIDYEPMGNKRVFPDELNNTYSWNTLYNGIQCVSLHYVVMKILHSFRTLWSHTALATTDGTKREIITGVYKELLQAVELFDCSSGKKSTDITTLKNSL
jgi:hypothetical protein